MMYKELKESFRYMSLYIARFVRDELEDLHSQNAIMDDKTMEEINRRVRSGIYEYFYTMTLPEETRKHILYWKYPPSYREQDEFDKIDALYSKFDDEISKTSNKSS